MICSIKTLRRLARLYPTCTIKEFIEVYTLAKLNK